MLRSNDDQMVRCLALALGCRCYRTGFLALSWLPNLAHSKNSIKVKLEAREIEAERNRSARARTIREEGSSAGADKPIRLLLLQ